MMKNGFDPKPATPMSASKAPENDCGPVDRIIKVITIVNPHIAN